MTTPRSLRRLRSGSQSSSRRSPAARLTTFPLRLILNHMVEYSGSRLNHTFAALADPTRRAMLAMLHKGNRSVSELAKPFPMSLQATMKHLDVLSKAGLITRKKEGRTVACALRPQPLKAATRWLKHHEQMWEERLDRFEEYVGKLQ
jgi:DNA-binding transcriptional ArsR family regulator